VTAAPLLQLDAVSVHYGSGAKAVTALAGIDLRVERTARLRRHAAAADER
jgi:putative ABC transport system ATP-binding protein